MCLYLVLAGCGDDNAGAVETAPSARVNTSPVPAPVDALQEDAPVPSISFDFSHDNPRYLFIVNDHSEDELMALLQRANQTLDEQPDTYENLDIIVMLHGPDIGMFRKSNYASNRELIDLAAKLDAFNIIDMQVCDTSLELFEIGREEVPPFIESVPYAPDEIERLQQQGYINL